MIALISRAHSLGIVLLVLISIQFFSNRTFADDFVPTPLADIPRGMTKAKNQQNLFDYYDSFATEYLAKTKDAKEVQQAAAQFIRDAGRYFVLGYYSPEDNITIAARGEKVRSDGSQDPLVELYILELMDPNDKSLAEGIVKRAAAAYPLIAASGYDLKVSAKLYCLHFGIHNRQQPRLPSKLRKGIKYEPVLDSLQAWLDAEKGDLSKQRTIWYDLLHNLGHIRFEENEKVKAALKQKENGHQWIQLMLMAEDLRRQAIRLSPRTNKNPDPNAYRLALQDTFNVYKSAHQVAPQFPEAASWMLAMCQNDPEFGEMPRFWFEQAVKAEFDRSETHMLYRSYLSNTLDQDKVVDLAIECGNSGRYDTAVPHFLIDNLLEYDRDTGRQFNLWSKPGVYDAIQVMIQGYLQANLFKGEPLKDASRSWLYAELVAISLRASQFQKANEYWDKATEADLRRAMRVFGFNEPLEVLKSKAEAQGGNVPVRDFEKKIKEIATAKDLAAVRLELRQIRAKTPQAPKISWFVYAEACLNNSEALLAGRKADLKMTPELLSYLSRGEWELTEKNYLRASGTNDLQLPYVRSYGPFEVSMEVAISKLSALNGPVLGIVLGNTVDGFVRPARYFGFVPGQDAVLPLTRDSATPWSLRVTGRTVNKLRIRVWDEFAEFFINEERVFCQPCPGFIPNGAMQLIAPGVGKDAQVIYANISVKKLTEEPPPMEAPKLYQYFTASLKKYDDPRTHRLRGDLLLQNNKIPEAIADYQAVLKKDPRDVTVLQTLARALHYDKRYADELAALQALVKLTPESRYALTELAWFLATCPDDKLRDGAAALKQAEAAEKLQSKSSALLWIPLMAAMLEQKDTKSAAELLKRHEKTQLPAGSESAYRFSLIREALKQQMPVRATPKLQPIIVQVRDAGIAPKQ